MANRVYAPEVKAQVIADLTLGMAAKAVARKYDVPDATVRYWRDTERAKAQPLLAPQKRADLGQLVYDYLVAGLTALRAQAGALGDAEWFQKQGPSTYLIHGTLADKMVIVFQGIELGQPDDQSDDLHSASAPS